MDNSPRIWPWVTLTLALMGVLVWAAPLLEMLTMPMVGKGLAVIIFVALYECAADYNNEFSPTLLVYKCLDHLLNIAKLPFKLARRNTRSTLKKLVSSKKLRELIDFYRDSMFDPSYAEIEMEFAQVRQNETLHLHSVYLDHEPIPLDALLLREKRRLIFRCVRAAIYDLVKESLSGSLLGRGK